MQSNNVNIIQCTIDYLQQHLDNLKQTQTQQETQTPSESVCLPIGHFNTVQYTDCCYNYDSKTVGGNIFDVPLVKFDIEHRQLHELLNKNNLSQINIHTSGYLNLIIEHLYNVSNEAAQEYFKIEVARHLRDAWKRTCAFIKGNNNIDDINLDENIEYLTLRRLSADCISLWHIAKNTRNVDIICILRKKIRDHLHKNLLEIIDTL